MIEIWWRYWRLVVLEFYDKRKNRHPRYLCKCDCWNEKIIDMYHLLDWHSKSCGCYRKDMQWTQTLSHWMSETRFFHTYHNIKNRCSYISNPMFKHYWWRWISYSWVSFDDFYNDMYKSYNEHVIEHWEKNTTIERIDNNLWYSKENCKWATQMEQTRNQRTNINITHNWVTKILKDWAQELGIEYWTLKQRYHKWVDLFTNKMYA
jgi:hypothetical protein